MIGAIAAAAPRPMAGSETDPMVLKNTNATNPSYHRAPVTLDPPDRRLKQKYGNSRADIASRKKAEAKRERKRMRNLGLASVSSGEPRE